MGNTRGFATPPLMPVLGDTPTLRLRHGSSDDTNAFVHRPRAVAAVATVGASLGCDWTVRAAGVPPIAFAIRNDGGVLSLCPSPGVAVFVDGKRAAPTFRPIYVGSRIDVGLLRIEVSAPELPSGEREEPTGQFVLPTLPAASFAAETPAGRPSLPEMACVLGRAVQRRVSVPWAMLASLAASAALYAFLLDALD